MSKLAKDKFHAHAPERAFVHQHPHLQVPDFRPPAATNSQVSILRRVALRVHAYLLHGRAVWLVRRPYVLPDGRHTSEVYFWVKALRQDIAPSSKFGQVLNQLDWMKANGFFHHLEFRESAYIRNHSSKWGPVCRRLLGRAILEPARPWCSPGEVELNLAREAGLSWAVPPDAAPVAGKLWVRVAPPARCEGAE